MKVLLVSPLPPPAGGIATWTETFQRYASQSGIELSIVNTALSKKRAVSADARSSLFDEIKRAHRILRDFKRQMRCFTPDIIHINSSCSPTGLLRDLLCIRRAKKTPVVLHCHCNIEDQAASRLGRWIFSRVARRAQKVLALNQISLSFAERTVPGKAALVPNFIEAVDVAPVNEIRDTIQNVVFVGHVKREKGIVEIYRTALRFPDITFRVIGPVVAHPTEMNKPSNVLLCGALPHDVVCEELRKADAFFFPSYTEGFSVAMLEAMAAGLPIVATDVGANRDMIGDRGGVIVPVGDVEAMCQAFQVLAPAQTRAAMSSWNRERVSSAYRVEHVISDMIAIYEELLA